VLPMLSDSGVTYLPGCSTSQSQSRSLGRTADVSRSKQRPRRAAHGIRKAQVYQEAAECRQAVYLKEPSFQSLVAPTAKKTTADIYTSSPEHPGDEAYEWSHVTIPTPVMIRVSFNFAIIARDDRPRRSHC
jgi:hypothetical protein